MTEPPAYPRVAHLVGGRGTSDDRVLTTAELSVVLARPIVVEEKLDGANVAVWVEGSRVECALRSGVGAMDRAGQLGPLRAWLAQHSDAIRTLVSDGRVLYAEWLLLTHSVAYDELPAYLVALDVRRADGTFLMVDERNAACAVEGLTVPPELWRGVAEDVAHIERRIGPSRYGPDLAEGVVVRTVDGSAPRVTKLLRPGFDRLADAAWSEARPRNQLADREASWH